MKFEILFRINFLLGEASMNLEVRIESYNKER